MWWKATSWRGTLLTAALGGAMLLGGTLWPSATAYAHDRDDKCFERIRRDERKLERDIERHGVFSRQAEHRRHKLRELRERCRFERRHFGRWDRHRDRDDRWGRWGHGGHRGRDHDDRWHRRD